MVKTNYTIWLNTGGNRNNEVKDIPNLHYIYGDRDKPEKLTRTLTKLNTELGIEKKKKVWKLVVDFCAFEKKHIRVRAADKPQLILLVRLRSVLFSGRSLHFYFEW